MSTVHVRHDHAKNQASRGQRAQHLHLVALGRSRLALLDRYLHRVECDPHFQLNPQYQRRLVRQLVHFRADFAVLLLPVLEGEVQLPEDDCTERAKLGDYFDDSIPDGWRYVT